MRSQYSIKMSRKIFWQHWNCFFFIHSYRQILEQFVGVSYGDPVFGRFVLIPLQQRHSIQLRKLVWCEMEAVLRFLSTPIDKVGASILTIKHLFFGLSYNCLTVDTILFHSNGFACQVWTYSNFLCIGLGSLLSP